MKSLLSSPPVLWFLFLFNLAVAAIAPFAVAGPQGLLTSAGMGVVALGAGMGLLTRSRQARLANPEPVTGTWLAPETPQTRDSSRRSR